MASLDTTQQKLLEKDSGNPNSPKKADPVLVRPGMGFSKSTTGPPKPSLRETMLAQKKAAMAAKTLPARPGSAMSTFQSPMRTVSGSSISSTASGSADAAPVRSRPESTTVSHGGLSVAPMRPTKFRPRPEPTRPATAGPYSVRGPAQGSANTVKPTTSTTNASPSKARPTATTSSPPKRGTVRPNTSHSSHASVASVASASSHTSTHTSPSRDKAPTGSRIPISPRGSPRSSRSIKTGIPLSSPSKADEDFTMVMPSGGISHESNLSIDSNSSKEGKLITPGKLLKVYEDPFSNNGDQTTPRPIFTVPVLEEVPVNEDAANVTRQNGLSKDASTATGKDTTLLDSGIKKVKAKSLDVHGFRKVQSLIRENKASWTDGRYGALLLGLFDYLESPLSSLTPEKVQDTKAQILATIKLMLKNEREAFSPYVPRGLQSLLETRSHYDARAHIVSGLELLADELVGLANPEETTRELVAQLQAEEMTQEGCRTLNMGLHILKELLDGTMSYAPSEGELDNMGTLALRCLNSSESGVRKDAVQLCVAMHARVGEKRFWGVMSGVQDDPKSLITYYIVKRQRETANS
jgi:CLIP-associating protein 1/2